MTKYLVIDMSNLTFVKQIETDIPEDTIYSMDRDELEGTFNLDDFEVLLLPKILKEKLDALQKLLDEDKFVTNINEDIYLLSDYESDD